MHTRPKRKHQGGAIIITVALLLVFLLTFIGISVDFSRMFVIKSELQTAVDACALSAANELDGQPTAIARARSAGLSAGNANRVNFQSANWGGQGLLTAESITFRNSSNATMEVPEAARYAVCTHSQPAVQMWLLNIKSAFGGDASIFPQTRAVGAYAIATRGAAQSTCPLPLGLRPTGTGSAPNYGFQRGQWVRLLMAQNAAAGGEIGWANLDGSNSASETEAEMNGRCGTQVGDDLGTPGVQASIADAWNYRFGIYRNNINLAANPYQRPDYTGYSYTNNNWPSPYPASDSRHWLRNAFDAPTPPAGAHPSAASFVIKRQSFASCADTGDRMRGGGPTAVTCESITGLSLNSFQNIAAPGVSGVGGHRQYGGSRRIALVPVINASGVVLDFACMFMLQPLTIPLTDTYLEFLGNASDPGSPCTTSGLPGGSAGPLVPVLVR